MPGLRQIGAEAVLTGISKRRAQPAVLDLQELRRGGGLPKRLKSQGGRSRSTH